MTKRGSRLLKDLENFLKVYKGLSSSVDYVGTTAFKFDVSQNISGFLSHSFTRESGSVQILGVL